MAVNHSRAFPRAVFGICASAALLMSCKSREYNNTDVKAAQGIPQGLIAEYGRDPARKGITKFVITGFDAKGQPATTVTRYAIGGGGFSPIQFIRDPDKSASPATSVSAPGSIGGKSAQAQQAAQAPQAPQAAPVSPAADGTNTSNLTGEGWSEDRPAEGAEIGATADAEGAAGAEAKGKEVLQDADNLFGTLLELKDDENYGYITNTPFPCTEAEELVFGEIRTTRERDKDQLCLLELHTMGSPGKVSVVLIGLDAKLGADGHLDAKTVKEEIAKRLRRDPAWGAAKIAAGFGVRKRSIDNGPPGSPGEGMDVEAYAQFTHDVYHKYKDVVDDKTRNTCLNNYSTVVTRWTDSQAHFWCQFPHEALEGERGMEGARTCYIKKILELKGADEAAGHSLTRPNFPKLAAATAVRQYHEAAYRHCVLQGEGPFLWIAQDTTREKTFAYVMQAVQLAFDFNIESEQKAVNAFYKRIAKTRPRRVNDTYPEWLPEQPRYAAIIKVQQAARVGWAALQGKYEQWLKTGPQGPGVPGRFAPGQKE